MCVFVFVIVCVLDCCLILVKEYEYMLMCMQKR